MESINRLAVTGSRTLVLAAFFSLVAGCASTPVTPVARAEIPKISPWWSSLFDAGATSDWDYEWSFSAPDYDVDGNEIEAPTQVLSARVRCMVGSVRREGALWWSEVQCEQVGTQLDLEQAGPRGNWVTDGVQLWSPSDEDKPPFGAPVLTDPPIAAVLEESTMGGSRTVVAGELWCRKSESIAGSGSACFKRGVGPVSYSDTSLAGAAETSSSLTRTKPSTIR